MTPTPTPIPRERRHPRRQRPPLDVQLRHSRRWLKIWRGWAIFATGLAFALAFAQFVITEPLPCVPSAKVGQPWAQ